MPALEELPRFLEGGVGRPLVLALLLAGGFVAGVVNTIAGGGSFLTLPLLMGLGLPATVANGTNRVGVILQNLVASATFHRLGYRDGALRLRLALPMTAGAFLGVLVAVALDDRVLRPLIGALFLGWALHLWWRPRRFEAPPGGPRAPRAGSLLAAAGIGVYGGFLQAGVGFPTMALLVGVLGHDPVRANATKVCLILVFTVATLPLFVEAGQVAWREGIVLAAGTMAGGWAGTHWQIRAGAPLVRRMLVVMVAVSGVAMIFLSR